MPSFVVNSVVNSKDLRHAPFSVRCRFLRSCFYYFLHFFLCIIVIQMCVGVQRYADVTMPHNILKCFRIHSGLRHIGTESVSANMRSNFWHLYPVNLVVLLTDMLKIFLPMKCHHRSAVLVQKQESAVPIYHRFNLWILSVGKNTLKRFLYDHGGLFHLGRSFNFSFISELATSYTEKSKFPDYIHYRKFAQKYPIFSDWKIRAGCNFIKKYGRISASGGCL